MLFTGKGDSGTTYFCDTPAGERVSKSAARVEALGALDEVTSYLGYCRALAPAADDRAVCLQLQHDLFTVQAHVAGSKQAMPAARVAAVERLVTAIERELPPITSFCVPGQTLISACFDVARTLARRAERRVVAVHEQEAAAVEATTLAYLNRLSSVLYALARRANALVGVAELAPRYQENPERRG